MSQYMRVKSTSPDGRRKANQMEERVLGIRSSTGGYDSDPSETKSASFGSNLGQVLLAAAKREEKNQAPLDIKAPSSWANEIELLMLRNLPKERRDGNNKFSPAGGFYAYERELIAWGCSSEAMQWLKNNKVFIRDDLTRQQVVALYAVQYAYTREIMEKDKAAKAARSPLQKLTSR